MLMACSPSLPTDVRVWVCRKPHQASAMESWSTFMSPIVRWLVLAFFSVQMRQVFALAFAEKTLWIPFVGCMWQEQLSRILKPTPLSHKLQKLKYHASVKPRAVFPFQGPVKQAAAFMLFLLMLHSCLCGAMLPFVFHLSDLWVESSAQSNLGGSSSWLDLASFFSMNFCHLFIFNVRLPIVWLTIVLLVECSYHHEVFYGPFPASEHTTKSVSSFAGSERRRAAVWLSGFWSGGARVSLCFGHPFWCKGSRPEPVLF